MNYRRSFLRIWILLTTIWLFVVGFIFIDSIISPTVPGRVVAVIDGELSVISIFSEEYSKLLDLAEAGELRRIKHKGMIPEFSYFQRLSLSQEELNREADEAILLMRSIQNENRWVNIRYALVMWLIPPTLLLVMGLAIGWAVAGFRR